MATNRQLVYGSFTDGVGISLGPADSPGGIGHATSGVEVLLPREGQQYALCICRYQAINMASVHGTPRALVRAILGVQT